MNINLSVPVPPPPTPPKGELILTPFNKKKKIIKEAIIIEGIKNPIFYDKDFYKSSVIKNFRANKGNLICKGCARIVEEMKLEKGQKNEFHKPLCSYNTIQTFHSNENFIYVFGPAEGVGLVAEKAPFFKNRIKAKKFAREFMKAKKKTSDNKKNLESKVDISCTPPPSSNPASKDFQQFENPILLSDDNDVPEKFKALKLFP